MKRIAIMAAALVAVAACSKGAKNNTTDTATAGGAVAPASDSTGAMSGSNGGAMGGAMSSDSSAIRNQSQSGMTDSSGKSTLGPNANQMSPTSGSPVTAKGDTLKKDSTKKAP